MQPAIKPQPRLLLTTAAAICRLAEPIALTAILPYAWLMTKDFGLDDASFYAGILIASYSLSEAAFSMFWGRLAIIASPDV